ncbi:retinal-binding protein-like isoform X2 [Tubulanus polymorphus]
MRKSYKLPTLEESMANASKSDKEAFALKQFKDNVKDVLDRDKYDDYELRKWLIARSWDVKKASEMFRDSLKFRKRIGADTILQDYTIPEVIKKYMPGGLVGHDKDGSPLKIELYGTIDMKGIMYSAKTVDLEKSKVFMCEEIVADWKRQSEKLGKRVDGLTVIFDMADVGATTHLWRPGIQMYLRLVKILEDNYPEMMKNMFVINTPRIFPILYKLSRPLVTEEMRKKIHVLGADYLPTLLNYIDPENLPVAYGGTQTDPDGNPLCRMKICQGGKVPDSYFLKDKISTKDMTCVNVEAGSKHDVETIIENKDSILRWDFKTEKNDIDFGVYYKNGDELEEILPMERVNSHTVPENGSVNCDKAGTYVVVFDNTFSWFHGKTVYYTVEVIASDDSLNNELDEIAMKGTWEDIKKDIE